MDQTSIKSISFSPLKKINPNRDCVVLLIVFGILLISTIVFNFYFYINISNGDMYINVSREELVLKSLKIDSLKKIVDNFESKKEIISKLKVEYIIDPSL
ncbi:MAG: hypothetical protein NTU76_00545 [Candidatus Taylorbacteria bacterium]|nr:hypothetical protein [Candidatus Taylorbacteria bacterium]